MKGGLHGFGAFGFTPDQIVQLGPVGFHVVEFPVLPMQSHQFELTQTDGCIAFVFKKDRLFARPVRAFEQGQKALTLHRLDFVPTQFRQIGRHGNLEYRGLDGENMARCMAGGLW